MASKREIRTVLDSAHARRKATIRRVQEETKASLRSDVRAIADQKQAKVIAYAEKLGLVLADDSRFVGYPGSSCYRPTFRLGDDAKSKVGQIKSKLASNERDADQAMLALDQEHQSILSQLSVIDREVPEQLAKQVQDFCAAD